MSTGTEESGKGTTNSGEGSQVVIRELDEFQTLTSTKQNVELFKILTAIAMEIDQLQQSTERRFSMLENLVFRVQEGNKKTTPPPQGTVRGLTNNGAGRNSTSSNSPKGIQSRREEEDSFKDCHDLFVTGDSINYASVSPKRLQPPYHSWPGVAVAAGKMIASEKGGSRRPFNDKEMDMLLKRNKALDMPVTLNVGGTKYEVRKINKI